MEGTFELKDVQYRYCVVSDDSQTPNLRSVINPAYKQDDAFFVDENRIETEQEIKDMISQGGRFIAVWKDSEMVACVYTEVKVENDDHPTKRMYMSLLSVNPIMKKSGLGSKLVSLVEEYAKIRDCDAIEFWVISLKPWLQKWYKDKGFVDTGKRQDWKDKSRLIIKDDVHFTLYEKKIKS